MKTKVQKDYLSKVFHVAIIFFATTIGIGLYALIGAPFRMPDMSPLIDKISKSTQSASAAVANMTGLSEMQQINDNEIIIKLSKPSNDYYTLKSTLIDHNLKSGKSYLVKFKLDDIEYGIPQLLNRMSDIKPSKNLMRVMQDSRYYVIGSDKHEGIVITSLSNSELAFASLIEWESKFIETTLPLIHPLFSKSDVSMYLEIGAVSRRISGVDSRVIYKGNDEIAYIWGIHKNNLIIAGSKNNFEKMINLISK